MDKNQVNEEQTAGGENDESIGNWELLDWFTVENVAADIIYFNVRVDNEGNPNEVTLTFAAFPPLHPMQPYDPEAPFPINTVARVTVPMVRFRELVDHVSEHATEIFERNIYSQEEEGDE